MKVINITVLLAVLMLFGTCAYAADCNSGGRYEDNNGNGTVTDCRTGLVWLKDANCTETSNGIAKPGGNLLWENAMKWVAGLQNGICSLTDGSAAGDWRLPTKTEWMAMVAYAKSRYTSPPLTDGAGTGQWTEGNVFNNVISNSYYWSSTTYASDTNVAWISSFLNGTMHYHNKAGYSNFVWPVRGGQAASFGSVRIE
jgi:hypothetical protein